MESSLYYVNPIQQHYFKFILIINILLLMTNHTITGKDIKKLVTRFQYKKQEMCFEILLKLNNSEEMVSFLKTTDHSAFREAFDDIITIRTENYELDIQQMIHENMMIQASAGL